MAGSDLPGGGRGLEPSGEPAVYFLFIGVTGSEVAADTGFEGGADRLGLPLIPKSFAPCKEQPFFILSQRIQRLGLGLLESRSQATLASRHQAHYKKGVNKGVREKEKGAY